MSDGKDLVRLIGDELVAFTGPVVGAALNPWQRARLLRSLGWDLTAISGFDAVQFEAWLKDVGTAVEAVVKLIDEGLPTSFNDIKRIGEEGKAAAKAVTGAPPLGKLQLPASLDAATLGQDLLAFLTVNRLYRASPVAYRSAILLGIVTPARDNAPSAPVPADPAKPPVRLPRRRDALHLDRLIGLVAEPGATLKEVYCPDGLGDAAKTDHLASLLFPRLAGLLAELGVHARYGVDPGVGPPLGAAGGLLAAHMLTFEGVVSKGGVRLPLGATLALSAPDRGGLGLVVVPHAAVELTTTVKRWRFDLGVKGDLPAAFAIGEDGLTWIGGAGRLELSAAVTRLADAKGHAFLLGAPTTSHLAIGRLELAASATLGTPRDDVNVAVRAGASEVVVKAGDGDAFLRKVLPAEGLKAAFDLGIAWSRSGGLHVDGGAALATTLPLHVTLGPVRIEDLYLALAASSQTHALQAAAAVTVRLEIGKFKAVAERVGVVCDLTFPPEGGNLGAANVDMDFKPPDGLGVTIDGGPVTGGGYLFIDKDKGHYAGALELRFREFRLAAIGLLNTKLPDGKPILDSAGEPTWSLIVVAAAQWKPIHLIWGVHIAGAGIVVGINRTAALDELRAGVKTKALDAVLFPPNPVGNAPQLVAVLGKLFPAAPGRTTLGLMAQFTWGPGRWLSLDLALLLELPSPLRLIILGRIALSLPEPDPAKPQQKKILALRLDAVGILDFDRSEFSLDASFVDSKLGDMPLTGDMAVRAAWGQQPRFALSAGGFHPRFVPPTGFPTLGRIALSIGSGDSQARLEAYLAITSNTLQFGARLEAKAKLGKLSVQGFISFDALIRFWPPGFELDIAGGVELKWGDKVLLAILLEAHFSGPGPWLARGHARFHLWFLEGSIPFEITSGSAGEAGQPSPTDISKQLSNALSAAGAWTVAAPATSPFVTLRAIEVPADAVLAHPLGSVGVQQHVVPLNVGVTRVGVARMDPPRTYTIATATFNGAAPSVQPEAICDWFAPSEFFDLTDDERLSGPDFRWLEAGRRFGSPATTAAPRDQSVYAAIEYEQVIYDDPAEAPQRPDRAPLPQRVLAVIAGTAPAAVGPARALAPARFAGRVARVGVHEPTGAGGPR